MRRFHLDAPKPLIRFNPHPGWLPGETHRRDAIADAETVSIRTRVGYRVRQRDRRRVSPSASSFNPHPGWLPGETIAPASPAPSTVSFNPHPGWLPGETYAQRVREWERTRFNPHPGWLPGETPPLPIRPHRYRVSIRTRVGYRVRLGGYRLVRRGLLGFNPHPGWLPGETRPILLDFPRGGEFQSAPGLVTG